MDFHPATQAAFNAVSPALGDQVKRCMMRAAEIACAGTKTTENTLGPHDSLWHAILTHTPETLPAALDAWMKAHTLPAIPPGVKVDTRDFFAARSAIAALTVSAAAVK